LCTLPKGGFNTVQKEYCHLKTLKNMNQICAKTLTCKVTATICFLQNNYKIHSITYRTFFVIVGFTLLSKSKGKSLSLKYPPDTSNQTLYMTENILTLLPMGCSGYPHPSPVFIPAFITKHYIIDDLFIIYIESNICLNVLSIWNYLFPSLKVHSL